MIKHPANVDFGELMNNKPAEQPLHYSMNLKCPEWKECLYQNNISTKPSCMVQKDV